MQPDTKPDPAGDTAPRLAAVCETCLRPKYTEADLARWNAEFPDGQPRPDPEWAAAICWTKPYARCCCKPRPAITPLATEASA